MQLYKPPNTIPIFDSQNCCFQSTAVFAFPMSGFNASMAASNELLFGRAKFWELREYVMTYGVLSKKSNNSMSYWAWG